MNSIASWIGAIAIGSLIAICPQKSMAEGFTGKEFLKWSTSAQESYFQTSVTMAAIMATRMHKASGDCLGVWYLAPDANRDARHLALRSAIERNATHHPSAVIFLILEEACGPFVEDIN